MKVRRDGGGEAYIVGLLGICVIVISLFVIIEFYVFVF